ncbi:MAG TPA: ATP synthase F1 subunit gamma [Firmicutes bacterium]|mgnify:FL=1|nr:ATP synthase F1 subunit gamma [Bacillota bacterium]
MADSLLNVKKRIQTVNSIKKITNAMKLIASSRYNKLKTIFDNNFLYYNYMKKAMNISLKYVNFEDSKHIPTCLIENNSNKNLFILVSSTLGLCGSYFYNLAKLADLHLNKDSDVIFIGQKGYRKYKDKVNNSFNDFINLLDNLNIDSVNYFRHYLDNLYKKNNYKSVYIIYTSYINSLKVECKIEKLLPLQIDKECINDSVEPLFENSTSSIVDLIVPHYLDALLYRYFLESNLSEQTCRKNSMENASTSADKLIDNLMLLYNKVRQQNITNEITEIISGSNNDPINFI